MLVVYYLWDGPGIIIDSSPSITHLMEQASEHFCGLNVWNFHLLCGGGDETETHETHPRGSNRIHTSHKPPSKLVVKCCIICPRGIAHLRKFEPTVGVEKYFVVYCRETVSKIILPSIVAHVREELPPLLWPDVRKLRLERVIRVPYHVVHMWSRGLQYISVDRGMGRE